MIDLNDCYIASQVGIGICTAAQISQIIRQHVERIVVHMSVKFANKFTMLALKANTQLDGYLAFFDEKKDPEVYRFIRTKALRLRRQKREIEQERYIERSKKHLTRRFNRIISLCGLTLFAFIMTAPFFKERINSYIDPYIFLIICTLCLAPILSWFFLIAQTWIELSSRKIRLNTSIFWEVGSRFHATRVINSVRNWLWKNRK